jgi:hypothetical protein
MEPCDQPEAHEPHEHYGRPASLRRNCPGCTCTGPYPDAACPSHGVAALLGVLLNNIDHEGGDHR